MNIYNETPSGNQLRIFIKFTGVLYKFNLFCCYQFVPGYQMFLNNVMYLRVFLNIFRLNLFQTKLDSFRTNVPFFQPQRFSDAFREYEKRTLMGNRCRKLTEVVNK